MVVDEPLLFSDLYINSKSDIKVGYFHGDKLYLETVDGDINIDKYQGDVVRLIAYNGNIHINDFIQASDIDAAVVEKGVSSIIKDIFVIKIRVIEKILTLPYILDRRMNVNELLTTFSN